MKKIKGHKCSPSNPSHQIVIVSLNANLRGVKNSNKGPI